MPRISTIALASLAICFALPVLADQPMPNRSEAARRVSRDYAMSVQAARDAAAAKAEADQALALARALTEVAKSADVTAKAAAQETHADATAGHTTRRFQRR
jgi:hypothetical protein